jgi:hypothetical protein
MATNETRVLVGAVCRQQPNVLDAHLKTLIAQRLPPGVTFDFLWVDDNDNPDSKELLHALGQTFPITSRPKDAEYAIGPETHEWNVSTFEHLAVCKQLILRHAKSNRYDYVWLVDTDLLLDPSTFESMYWQKRPITSAVFWTNWVSSADTSLGPNVWLSHPYGLAGKNKTQHEFLQGLADRQFMEVAGGGACILIHHKAFENVHYHPRLAGLPDEGMWQGEDRTFSIVAERLHIKQYADAWPDIFHAYHPQDRTDEVLGSALAMLQSDRQAYAKYGDLVNFTLEALEEPALVDEILPVRGRLGGINMLPQIEATLLNLRVGEEAIFNIHFPYWYPAIQIINNPVVNYADTNKTFRIRLIDAKPMSYAPNLSDHMYRGIDL